jgi:hypothetical protein
MSRRVINRLTSTTEAVRVNFFDLSLEATFYLSRRHLRVDSKRVNVADNNNPLIAAAIIGRRGCDLKQVCRPRLQGGYCLGAGPEGEVSKVAFGRNMVET